MCWLNIKIVIFINHNFERTNIIIEMVWYFLCVEKSRPLDVMDDFPSKFVICCGQYGTCYKIDMRMHITIKCFALYELK